MNAAARKLAMQQIPTDEIVVGENRRPVDEAAVARLAESIREIGMRTPITVRLVESVNDETGEIDAAYWVVAGQHRLEACKKLGLPLVDAIVIETDEIDAELWEIAENLHRADLTKEQRDAHIRRFAELLTKKEEVVSRQNDPKPPRPEGRPKGVVLKIAEGTGLSKKTVRRALNPAKATEERKKAGIDADVKNRAAKEVADILAEYVPGEWWDALKANLYAAGAKKIADALTNISGQSVMDRRLA